MSECLYEAVTILTSVVNEQRTAILQAAHGQWGLADLKVTIYDNLWESFGIFSRKVCHIDVCGGGSLINPCKQDYKYLCAAATIYATLVDRKFTFLRFDPCDLEKYIKPELTLSFGADVPDAPTVQI